MANSCDYPYPTADTLCRIIALSSRRLSISKSVLFNLKPNTQELMVPLELDRRVFRMQGYQQETHGWSRTHGSFALPILR